MIAGTLSQKLESMSLYLRKWQGGKNMRYYVASTVWENRGKVPFILHGIWVSFYKTGNLSTAAKWDAEENDWLHISNSKARTFLNSQVYFTEDGELHTSQELPVEVLAFLGKLWEQIKK